jgi:hypothetical protein
MMRPRDLFGVAIRVIGFWILTEAAYSAFWAIMKIYTGAGEASITSAQHEAFAIFYAVLGAGIILFANPITWAVYGLSRQPGGVEPVAGSPTDVDDRD